MYLFRFRIPSLVERGNIGDALRFLLCLFLFAVFDRVELLFLFLRPAAAENIEYISALVEQPRFAF